MLRRFSAPRFPSTPTMGGHSVRIGRAVWNQAPNGQWFSRTGSDLKFPEVPQSVLDALGCDAEIPDRGYSRGASATRVAAARGRVALDTNAIIARLKGSPADVRAVANAMAGRRPSVSITVVKEFLAGEGDVNALRTFLTEARGGVGRVASQTLLKELAGLGLKPADARVVGSVIEEAFPCSRVTRKFCARSRTSLEDSDEHVQHRPRILLVLKL